MLKLNIKVLAPADYAGALFFENFIFGSDADPCAHDSATLAGRNFGAANIKRLCAATGTPGNAIKTIVGKQFQARVVEDTFKNRNGEEQTNNKLARGSDLLILAYPLGSVPLDMPTQVEGYKPKGGNGAQPRAAKVPESVPCPRCKEPFDDGPALDNHMAECLTKGGN
jgi:hypothetical protein